MIYFLGLILVVYLIFTLNFAIKLNKSVTHLTDNQLLLHNILIWVIPFFWVIILEATLPPTPGSSKFKKTKTKSNGGFYESGIGIWGAGDGHDHHSDGGHGGDGGHSNDGSD